MVIKTLESKAFSLFQHSLVFVADYKILMSSHETLAAILIATTELPLRENLSGLPVFQLELVAPGQIKSTSLHCYANRNSPHHNARLPFNAGRSGKEYLCMAGKEDSLLE